jgi:hypothetical protein
MLRIACISSRVLLVSEGSNASLAPCHSEFPFFGGRRTPEVCFELPVRRLTDESSVRSSRSKELKSLAKAFRVSILLKRQALECGPPRRAAGFPAGELARGLTRSLSIRNQGTASKLPWLKAAARRGGPHSRALRASDVFRAKPH